MGRGTGSVRLRGAPRRNIHNKWVMRVTLPRVGCTTEREIEDSFTGGAGADWAWWSERSSKTPRRGYDETRTTTTRHAASTSLAAFSFIRTVYGPEWPWLRGTRRGQVPPLPFACF